MCVKRLKKKTHNIPHPCFNKKLRYYTVIDVFEEESVLFPPEKDKHASFNFETGLMAKLSKNERKRKININLYRNSISYYIFVYLKAII